MATIEFITKENLDQFKQEFFSELGRGNTETVISIKRGDSIKPLYISSIGISNEEAVIKIESIHGTFSIPTILKLLDVLTKQ